MVLGATRYIYCCQHISTIATRYIIYCSQQWRVQNDHLGTQMSDQGNQIKEQIWTISNWSHLIRWNFHLIRLDQFNHERPLNIELPSSNSSAKKIHLLLFFSCVNSFWTKSRQWCQATFCALHTVILHFILNITYCDVTFCTFHNAMLHYILYIAYLRDIMS